MNNAKGIIQDEVYFITTTVVNWIDSPCRRICSNKTNVPADLHELLSAAKNLPELSIRIFNPITSYFLIYRYVFRIADPYIRYSRIAYPTEQ